VIVTQIDYVTAVEIIRVADILQAGLIAEKTFNLYPNEGNIEALQTRAEAIVTGDHGSSVVYALAHLAACLAEKVGDAEGRPIEDVIGSLIDNVTEGIADDIEGEL